MSSTEEFLEHYGIKGMHWGIRNKRSIVPRQRRTKKEIRTRKARQQVLNRRRQLSDTDLKKYVERLNNEKQLKTLIEADLKPGRTMTKKILGDSGKQVVGRVVGTVGAGAAMLGIKTLLDKKFKVTRNVKPEEKGAQIVDFIMRGGKMKGKGG